ncbi:TPA: hypothetical protein ACK3Q6_004083 [Burkholderia cepacia]|jgi:hypothetical protein|uniref:Phage gp6-like head-tail connector protein n=3 Tax=Burkholderia cepacia complex TaxID=87882 RepID=A0A250LN27_9BURK|nr:MULTISPECIES: hypothetical protein [Burkholderia]KKL36499.1 hypothetical protein WR31_25295 [Burkholderia contaminans LMG 23361]MBA9831096.1 hypothetical protein [Burkholderia contaminans]MBA9839155.1 hypothetical protein [Burkholderia contaminans]MBA9864466.1 hypothetical protein [Burkholderia contaminans]MBA9906736.1 hypothetical protein [Burkholderia contaminans]
MSSLKEVCITAAKKVFDNRADVEEFAQGYLESAIHRFAKDTSEIPPNVLANIAECAAWFIYDESIEKQISIPLPARRDMVAAHLRERFPLYAAS